MEACRVIRHGARAAMAGVVVLWATIAPARTWTMSDGQRVLDANFVSLDKEAVTLQTKDNKKRVVRLEELSEIDRNLAKRLGASSTRPIVVEVEADGLTPTEALQNAFMRAVQKAVGARVKSKLLTDGDKVVEDSILVFSDGFVSDYDSVSSRQEAGLCYERIKATVQRRDVSEKDGAQGSTRDASHLYAEAFTKVQRHHVAMAVLQDAIDRFNADMLDVTLLGRNKAEVLSDDPGKVSIRCDLRVKIRADVYREVFADMISSLTALSRARGSMTTKTYQLQPDDGVASPIVAQLEKQFLKPTDTSSIDYGTLFSLASDRAPSGGPDMDAIVKRGSDSTLFFVCVPSPGSGNIVSNKSCVWRWFEIDGHPLLPSQEISTVVRYTGGDGEPIYEDSLTFGVRTPGLSASGRGKKVRTVIVSPFFLYHISRGHYVVDIPHAREITIRKTLRVPLDDLSRVQGERVFVTGRTLDRDAEFPEDVEGLAGSRTIARNTRPVGGVERFDVKGGTIEVQAMLAGNEMIFMVAAKGFGNDTRHLSNWLSSPDFQQVVKDRVFAVAMYTGGSFRGQFGPFRHPGDDVITVEMTIRRQ